MQIISRKEAKELGLNRYFTGKPCKHGHISERKVINHSCIACVNVRAKQYYQKNAESQRAQKIVYYRKNKEKIADYQKLRKKINPEYNVEYQRKYREINKEQLLLNKKDYYQQNKKRIQTKHKERLNNDPLRYQIVTLLKRVQSNWKGGRAKAEELLGYKYEQLKQHIESQFVDGMGWENRSEWHIDHKKPVSVFIKEGVTDPSIVNALDNLQPLWAKDNLSKGAKWEG